jgi:ribosomal protein L18E
MATRTTVRGRFAVPVPPEGIEVLADHAVLATGEDLGREHMEPALALHAFKFAAAMSKVAHRQLGAALSTLAELAADKRQMPEEQLAGL